MNTYIFLLLFMATTMNAWAQKQSFDLATFTTPKSWASETTESAIQFSRQDKEKGDFASITLFKSIAVETNASENFSLAWNTLVKEMVSVKKEPDMQAPVMDEGWEMISGHTSFEMEAVKGAVVLVTSTGYGKMVSLIILTNTTVFEPEITAFLESMELDKPLKTSSAPGANALADGYTFNTTNFDDGWTSTVQDDWVQVTKGEVRVLIHYPNKMADEYTTDIMEGLKTAWNVLVSNRYASLMNVDYKIVSGWEAIEYVTAIGIEKETGRQVHVLLFKKNFYGGAGKYLEVITTGKRELEKEFGQIDASAGSWESVEKMANYNKFAVSANDLQGKWTSNFTGTLQYVNAYTGADLPMNTHASNENFNFGPGATYKWDLATADGPVGSIKFQGVKSGGKYSMVDNWHVRFSDIEGKPKVYEVSFSCIKGARILWVNDKAFARK